MALPRNPPVCSASVVARAGAGAGWVDSVPHPPPACLEHASLHILLAVFSYHVVLRTATTAAVLLSFFFPFDFDLMRGRPNIYFPDTSRRMIQLQPPPTRGGVPDTVPSLYAWTITVSNRA